MARVHMLIVLCLATFLLHAEDRPNVLFIAIDDLNDWVGCLGGHAQAHTPNIDELANRGVLFSNAHISAPGCSPSRNALLTGKEPFTTGYYAFYNNWGTQYLKDQITLPEHFKNSGYVTYASGKIHHGSATYDPVNSPREWTGHNNHNMKNLPGLKVDREAGAAYNETTGKMLFAPTTSPLEDHPDYETARYGIEVIREKHDKPFFLALGFIKPHLPFIAPKKYFDLIPDTGMIKLPPILVDDLVDVPWAGRSNVRIWDDVQIRKLGIRKDIIRAYLACGAFIDDMIGEVLKALEESPYADNTIIVLWSDHGWHLGEKRSFRKFSLWEESTHVPLIIVDPNFNNTRGMKCEKSVSLINIYPTLIELCGLKNIKNLDGYSLVPLLKNVDNKWAHPAITTWGHENYCVRTNQYRYIRYFDGSEELYDHQTDENEWINCASREEYASIKKKLAKYLPRKSAPFYPYGGLELRNVDIDQPGLEEFKKNWENANQKCPVNFD